MIIFTSSNIAFSVGSYFFKVISGIVSLAVKKKTAEP